MKYCRKAATNDQKEFQVFSENFIKIIQHHVEILGEQEPFIPPLLVSHVEAFGELLGMKSAQRCAAGALGSLIHQSYTCLHQRACKTPLERTLEFPVERSNFRSNVQNSKKRVIRKIRWYFEFPVEHCNFWSKVRILGRTFEIQKNGSSEKIGGTSNFRSNVRISGRTFKMQKKRVIRKFRPPPPKSYKNHMKTYEKHINSYENI